MNGIRFDMTVTLGTLIQIGGTVTLAVIAWYGFKGKIELILQKQDIIVGQHTELLNNLDHRLGDHEKHDESMFREMQTRLTDLVGGVQRLVGQNETIFRRGVDRRDLK